MTEPQGVAPNVYPFPGDALPCPFCGGEPMLLTFDFGFGDARWWASCQACAADGSWAKNPGSAAANWNRRVPVLAGTVAP